jgi:poly [ADP-ribose] polymerase
VVQLAKNESLGDGFILQVELAEIHVPRMWVEEHEEHGTKVSRCTID